MKTKLAAQAKQTANSIISNNGKKTSSFSQRSTPCSRDPVDRAVSKSGQGEGAAKKKDAQAVKSEVEVMEEEEETKEGKRYRYHVQKKIKK